MAGKRARTLALLVAVCLWPAVCLLVRAGPLNHEPGAPADLPLFAALVLVGNAVFVEVVGNPWRGRSSWAGALVWFGLWLGLLLVQVAALVAVARSVLR